jgi:hypothetical protein
MSTYKQTPKSDVRDGGKDGRLGEPPPCIVVSG